MYLLYEVIQLRKSSLGHTLLTKRQNWWSTKSDIESLTVEIMISIKNSCSMYVQLSRLRSLSGLHLLQKIDMNDLEFRPHDDLVAEMGRLHQLEQETLASWARQEHTFR